MARELPLLLRQCDETAGQLHQRGDKVSMSWEEKENSGGGGGLVSDPEDAESLQ